MRVRFYILHTNIREHWPWLPRKKLSVIPRMRKPRRQRDAYVYRLYSSPDRNSRRVVILFDHPVDRVYKDLLECAINVHVRLYHAINYYHQVSIYQWRAAGV